MEINATSHRKKVCVCDDEVAIADLVGQLLEADGYEAFVCYSATELYRLMEQSECDLVLLDIMMPGEDGFDCCRKIRTFSQVPIIFLTARDEEIDKVIGFELGADDYVVKPFKPRELLARVKARLRRPEIPPLGQGDGGELLEAMNIVVDIRSHEASFCETPLTLTPKEFAILALLIRRRGTPVASKDLFEEIWDERADASSNNTVMVHIRNVRKKLAMIDSSQDPIETVWGVGYKIG